MIISEDQYLAHYGILRKSGRYPWGSGENPYQRNQMFMGIVKDLRDSGMSEAQIARSFELTTTQLTAAKSIAKNQNRQADINMAQRLKDKGWSNVAIGDRMQINESSVRSLLAPGAKDRADVLSATATMLKEEVDRVGLIDIGAGVEHHVGVSDDRLNTAVAMLQEEGYKVHYVKVDQLGTNHQTTLKVLSKPDVPYREVYNNRDQIGLVARYSEDKGRSYETIGPPVSIDSDRVQIKYKDEGADLAEGDGVIWVRPGVDDVSIGASNYAQVRIAVDDTHFLKGMAVYNSDMPDGVDLIYNVNKTQSEAPNKHDVMKPMKADKDNPFGGSRIERQHGVMNVLREEGDWKEWSKTLASQMLSKQPPSLAKQQLDLAKERRQADLDEVLTLTNPAVKRLLLDSVASDADSAASHLKAAALPNQSSHVILPVSSMKPTEVYAPNYSNGESVVLIRYPHGGTFEIPTLTVNNRHPEAQRLIGTSAKDAIGINSSVAERMSGADFDGDTVLVIPNDSGRIKTAPPLEGLKNFDPIRAYPAYEGMPRMTPALKQAEMGRASNLITDMTINGASSAELARAVRHSMVVIDAEKKYLDYKQSAIDNGISQLKEKYQGGARSGASTLISRSSSKAYPNERKPRPASEGGPIDRDTGKLVFVDTGRTYVDAKGKEQTATTTSTKMREVSDARDLSSGTPIEEIYASYANDLKAMANEARREMVAVQNTPWSPSAKAAYPNEVASLNAKLIIAESNAPRERQAQLLANSVVEAKRQANPDLDSDDVKKLKAQELARARASTGASKERIDITTSEWEAIQAGAISNHRLEQILRNTDLDRVRELATPRTERTITPAMSARARSMLDLGYTQADIAETLGISVSAVHDIIS